MARYRTAKENFWAAAEELDFIINYDLKYPLNNNRPA